MHIQTLLPPLPSPSWFGGVGILASTPQMSPGKARLPNVFGNFKVMVFVEFLGNFQLFCSLGMFLQQFFYPSLSHKLTTVSLCCMSACVLMLNQGGTNHNHSTQRLAILQHRPTNSKVVLNYPYCSKSPKPPQSGCE